MDMKLTALTGKFTSDGSKPVLFEAPLPPGCAGVYSTGGKVYFYGAKNAITPTSVGQLDIASIVQQAVAAALAAQK